MEKKSWGTAVIYLAAAAVVLLAFGSRVSPFYSLLLGEYGSNGAAEAMLIGKYWLEGELPYQDLFAVGGPLYFIIQGAGWFLGGRTGILVLAIISLWIYLIFLHRTLGLFVGKRATVVLTLISLIPYVALSSGGNSEMEWCLPLCSIALFYVFSDLLAGELRRKTHIILGAACSMVFMIGFHHGGLIYGLILYVLSDALRRKKFRGLGQAVLDMLWGAGVPTALVLLCYIKVDKTLLWEGGFLYVAKQWFGGFDSLAVIVHKAVKCALMVPVLAAAVHRIWKKEQQLGICLLFGAFGTLFFLFCADNVWYDYMITVPWVFVAAAVFLREECRVCRRIGAPLCIVGALIICAVPLKNYVSYLVGGIPDVIGEFVEDFKTYRAADPEAKILILDTDSSYLLELDEKPVCRYFTDQTELESYGADVSAETAAYLEGAADLVITTDKGWIGRELEYYAVTQVYCKVGGSVFIYIPY